MPQAQPGTRRLRIGCEFNHVAQVPTPAAFLIRPAADAPIVCETWTTDPVLEYGHYNDLYGNEVRRVILPAGESLVSYYAIANVPDEVDEADFGAPALLAEDLPHDALVYLLPSRYCQSDMLSGPAWDLFGSQERSYELVAKIQDWVWNHIEYRTGSTGSWWTAKDSFDNGYGVCRDFAHLMVTMCRAVTIPARYCYGYLPDMDVEPLPTAMDFHAWVEVYLGDRWYTFDPRHNARRKGHVPIARGRDATDLAMVTTWGVPWLRRLTVWADEDFSEPWPPLDTSMTARDPFTD